MLMRFRIYKEDAMGFRNFIKEDDGVGTVEVVLLLVVIVVLVILFRERIKKIVTEALTKINENSDKIIKDGK